VDFRGRKRLLFCRRIYDVRFKTVFNRRNCSNRLNAAGDGVSENGADLTTFSSTADLARATYSIIVLSATACHWPIVFR